MTCIYASRVVVTKHSIQYFESKTSAGWIPIITLKANTEMAWSLSVTNVSLSDTVAKCDLGPFPGSFPGRLRVRLAGHPPYRWTRLPGHNNQNSSRNIHILYLRDIWSPCLLATRVGSIPGNGYLNQRQSTGLSSIPKAL